jgi:hypothetical protein
VRFPGATHLVIRLLRDWNRIDAKRFWLRNSVSMVINLKETPQVESVNTS